jgi:hypothetical protein
VSGATKDVAAGFIGTNRGNLSHNNGGDAAKKVDAEPSTGGYSLIAVKLPDRETGCASNQDRSQDIHDR